MVESSPSTTSIFGLATTSAIVILVATVLLLRRNTRNETFKNAPKDAPGEGSRFTTEPTRTTAQDEQESWESHVKGHGSLREIWPGTLFVLEAEGCDRGPPVRNMIIYRIPTNHHTNHDIQETIVDHDYHQENHPQHHPKRKSKRQLLIYNAIAVRSDTLQEIVSLGLPTGMVVPNYLHRCCAAVWKSRFPHLQVVCPETAKPRVSEVVSVDMSIEAFTHTEQPWCKWVHSKVIDGWRDFENVIEVELENHPPPLLPKKRNGTKQAMIVCDLLFTVPFKKHASYGERFLMWLLDSSIDLPVEGNIMVPKVARLSRIFAIQDWSKAEMWYRHYAANYGTQIAVILVGHGPPVVEVNSSEGCTEALEGVANQLRRPHW